MSCFHGNHVDACDICDEVDAAYRRGHENGVNSQKQEIADWNKGYGLLMKESHQRRLALEFLVQEAKSHNCTIGRCISFDAAIQEAESLAASPSAGNTVKGADEAPRG